MTEKDKSVVQTPPKSEAAGLIERQLAVARDIAILSGNQLAEPEAMLLATMYQSGYFKSMDSLSKAVTRVVFGKMIGIDVATSLTSLYIIDGKPGLESKAIRNTLVMAGYDIKTIELDTTHCLLEWWFRGKELGVSEFTVEDAKSRGYVDPTCVNYPKEHNVRAVSKYQKRSGRYEQVQDCECKDNWKAMPKEMLMARATSLGNTMYGNMAFKTEVYDVDELKDSPFRVDTTPLDVALSQIEKATSLEGLMDIMKELDDTTREQAMEAINAKSKQLIEADKAKDTKTDAKRTSPKN